MYYLIQFNVFHWAISVLPGDLTQIDLFFVTACAHQTRKTRDSATSLRSRVPHGSLGIGHLKRQTIHLCSYTLNLTWNSDMAWQCPVKFRVFFPDLTHKPSVSACSETCKIAPSSLQGSLAGHEWFSVVALRWTYLRVSTLQPWPTAKQKWSQKNWSIPALMGCSTIIFWYFLGI